MIRNFIDENNFEYYDEASLKNYNSYKIDVICRVLVFPKSKEELASLVSFLNSNDCKYLVLGNGSNVIFSKSYYDGVIIKLDRMKNISVNGNVIEVETGYSLIKLSLYATLRGLSGLEFASGIPGNIGASVAMNAGAYKQSLSSVVSGVLVLNPDLEFVYMKNEELNFAYRDSFFKSNHDYIIVSCTLNLEPGCVDEMLEIISRRRIRRIEAQPLNYPSAGSVFRNPEGMYAGALIESCGLKGYTIGGAMVSMKHANFIINYNNATGRDIVLLINKVRDEVYKKYNVELLLEQIIID